MQETTDGTVSPVSAVVHFSRSSVIVCMLIFDVFDVRRMGCGNTEFSTTSSQGSQELDKRCKVSGKNVGPSHSCDSGDSNGRADSANSALGGCDHLALLARAQSKVHKARSFLQVALQIAVDANRALSSAVASADTGANRVEAIETVRSASFVASLAQQKSLKARAFLATSLRQLADAKTAVKAARLSQTPLRPDAEDTAISHQGALQKSSALQPFHLYGTTSNGNSLDIGTSASVFGLHGSGMKDGTDIEKLTSDDWCHLLDDLGTDLNDDDVLEALKDGVTVDHVALAA